MKNELQIQLERAEKSKELLDKKIEELKVQIAEEKENPAFLIMTFQSPNDRIAIDFNQVDIEKIVEHVRRGNRYIVLDAHSGKVGFARNFPFTEETSCYTDIKPLGDIL